MVTTWGGPLRRDHALLGPLQHRSVADPQLSGQLTARQLVGHPSDGSCELCALLLSVPAVPAFPHVRVLLAVRDLRDDDSVRDHVDHWNRVATVLAGMPDVIDRLTLSHRDDGSGWCTVCTTPGRGTPHAQWPCPLAQLASTARKIRAGR